jgi:ABC transport system ATP-binding/permease protein
MAVLLLRGIQKSFGAKQVLREAELIVEPGQRVGVVGVNGSGKSTLLKIAAGRLDADGGEVYRTPDVAMLDQDPVLPGRTVGEAAEDALSRQYSLLAEHRDVAEKLSHTPSDALELRLADLHARIERGGGWELGHRVDSILERVAAPPKNALLANLSGGERRRVALARVLLMAPELLILDEPTNHLDADTVEWLQGALRNFPGALLLVTHDRYFLDEVAERIVEVEDGETVAYEGGYGDYLLARAERMILLRKAEDRRMRMIATEAEWAARKPSAQRKHDRARLARLEALRAARPLLRQDPAEFKFVAADSLPGTVLEVHDLTVRRGNRTLMHKLELSLGRGERLGVIGPNGAGKTTLLKALTGELSPDSGTVVWAKRTKMSVFAQERADLDPRLTVKEAVGGADRPGATVSEVVELGGTPMTLPSFLERFLFPRESWDLRLATLSGGEKARVLLARLVRQGANVLILDEPTNDLDLVTLRVLEEALLGFGGACIVVTHDRWFLDRVATAVLAFEGEGKVVRYADFSQHRRAVEERDARVAAAERARAAELAAAQKLQRQQQSPAGKKLSYKEQRELEELPTRIETAEARKSALEERLSDPALYKQPAQLKEVQTELAGLEAQLPALYSRWEELESRR